MYDRSSLRALGALPSLCFSVAIPKHVVGIGLWHTACFASADMVLLVSSCRRRESLVDPLGRYSPDSHRDLR